MSETQDYLSRLRKLAELSLDTRKAAASTADRHKMDDIIHELNVHQAELEMQFEELREAKQSLEVANQRYSNLFNHAPIAYLVTDRYGKILEANRMVNVLFGVTSRSVEGVPLAELINHEDRDIYFLHRQAALHSGHVQQCEVRIESESFAYGKFTTCIYEDGQQTLLTAVVDITPLKRAQIVLAQVLADEVRINRVRSRVLAVVAHEFRTPLTAILSSVDILQRYGDRLPPDKRDQRYQTIRNLVWYLNDVVQEIAVAPQIKQDIPALKPESFHLPGTIRQLVRDVNPPTEERGILLRLNTCDDGEIVTWDQKLFYRTVMSVMENALRYSEGDVLCDVHIDPERVVVRIIDEGMGIPADDQPHIYEAFYRGKNVEFIPGTGIGLYVAERAVTAHGGSIRCESHVGQGAAFTIELPRHLETAG